MSDTTTPIEHDQLQEITTVLGTGVPVFLVGPAGSGKTLAAEMASRLLDLKFFCMSVGSQTTMSHLFGYCTATGEYVSTAFRKAYEGGGLFLLDEYDAGNANVSVALNAALGNGYCSFPDKMVMRHEKFVCMAAGNTYGSGATPQYIGRNKLDDASLDRFAFIDWAYDLKMEKLISSMKDWCERVHKIRKAVEEGGIKLIVSTRAITQGEKLLAAGIPQERVERMLIWRGADPTIVSKIKNALTQKKSDEKKQGSDGDKQSEDISNQYRSHRARGKSTFEAIQQIAKDTGLSEVDVAVRVSAKLSPVTGVQREA
jgi:hypothetical protein